MMRTKPDATRWIGRSKLRLMDNITIDQRRQRIIKPRRGLRWSYIFIGIQ